MENTSQLAGDLPIPPPPGTLWPTNDQPWEYGSSDDCEKDITARNLQVPTGWEIGPVSGDNGKWYIAIWPVQQQQPEQ